MMCVCTINAYANVYTHALDPGHDVFVTQIHTHTYADPQVEQLVTYATSFRVCVCVCIC